MNSDAIKVNLAKLENMRVAISIAKANNYRNLTLIKIYRYI